LVVSNTLLEGTRRTEKSKKELGFNQPRKKKKAGVGYHSAKDQEKPWAATRERPNWPVTNKKKTGKEL